MSTNAGAESFSRYTLPGRRVILHCIQLLILLMILRNTVKEHRTLDNYISAKATLHRYVAKGYCVSKNRCSTPLRRSRKTHSSGWAGAGKVLFCPGACPSMCGRKGHPHITHRQRASDKLRMVLKVWLKFNFCRDLQRDHDKAKGLSRH